MSDPLEDPVPVSVTEAEPLADEATPPRRGLSGLQIASLVVAVAFLVGAIAYVVGDRSGGADPLNATDVGFMQDMGYHHEQAVAMSLLLLGKDDVDPDLKSYAQEIIVGQRYEQGVFSATLDRFGHASSPGDTVMGWMGEPMDIDDMTGLATEEQLQQLRDADGEEAEALWIALMSEHHLAGLHMADEAARRGQDRTTVNLAKGMVKNQRSEVVDLARYRTSHDLPIPDGFTDPMDDQRLDPLSFRDQGD